MDFDSDQASKRLCKILFAEHVSGTAHVELNFVPAALTDVFESFSLTMSTHIPAEDHVSNHAIPAIHASLQQAEREKTSASHRKLQASEFSLESALKAVQSTVQKLGTFVDDAVAAANFAKEVFTAENEQISNSSSADLVNFNVDTVTHAGPQCQFSFDKSFTKADNSSAGSADITGTCQNCCAHVGATVTLNIDISGGQKLIRSLQTPSLTFMLGPVPIKLAIGTPVYLGFDASVSGSLHLTADMGMSAKMKSGFVYTGGATNFINDLSFSSTGSGVNMGAVDAVSATVRFFLLPIPALNVNYMATNAGLDGTIGADIHIGLAGQNLYSSQVPSISTFSLHHVLKKAFCPATQSVSTASSGRRLQQSSTGSGTWAQIGNVWQGAQVYNGTGASCSRENYPPYVAISLQLVERYLYGSGPGMRLLATINA
ncbi:hypothetical protein WJX77_000233 [Trebouxia sp. C0004]